MFTLLGSWLLMAIGVSLFITEDGFAASSVSCKMFFESMLPVFRAPSQKVPHNPPSRLIEEWGYFPDATDLRPTKVFTPDGNEVEHLLPEKFMVRVVPDPHTPLGRYALAMKKRKTQVFLGDDSTMLQGVNGQFKSESTFSAIDPQSMKFGQPTIGRSVTLNRNSLNTKEFHVTSMHEAFHDQSERIRASGYESRFNSYLTAVDTDQGLLKPYRIYSEQLHTDEVHTYTKEFIHHTMNAHNRETVREIEAQLKRMPDHLRRDQKLRNVKIAYDSVIDHQGHLESYVNLHQITTSHQKNIEHVRGELIQYLNGQPGSKLKLSRDSNDRLVLSTDRVNFVLMDIDVYRLKVDRAGRVDLKPALRKIEEVIEMDEQVLGRLNQSLGTIRAAEKNGFFTGESYYRLKNELASLAQAVKVDLPTNELIIPPENLLPPAQTFGSKGLPGLKSWFRSSDSMIHAPSKKELVITDGVKNGKAVDLVEKGPEGMVVSQKPMNQIQPGTQDEWSKIAHKLGQQGTAIVTYRNRFGPKGAFVDLRVKGSFDNDQGVIILNSSTSAHGNTRAVLGHEAYHSKMQINRSKGKKDPYHSEFISKTQSGGSYDQYVSSEEIHAWSKEFNQAALKAHPRDTRKMIDDRVRASGLPREEALKKIQIKAKTVIADDYRRLNRDYRMLLEAHGRLAEDVASRLRSGEFKLKFDDLESVEIETPDYVFKAGNFRKLKNGSAELYQIQAEVDQLVKINRKLQRHLDRVEDMIQQGERKGHFTAEEYERLKNEMSLFGSTVTTVVP